MDKLFKIHCSQIGKISGHVGLTDNQTIKLNELVERKKLGLKPLTANMELELIDLIEKKNNPKLPETCTTYLKEWYANDREEIRSKYIDKGNMVELDLIDFMAEQLNLGMAEKNTITMHNEYVVGTADVVTRDTIIDVKAAWSIKTLHDAVTSGINSDYEWQGRGYMMLWDRPNFVVFHGLLNTPEEANYGVEVSYDDIPADQRWVAYKVQRDVTIEQQIIQRVIECREWLTKYDKLVQGSIGKIH
jgi:hypothetical protein